MVRVQFYKMLVVSLRWVKARERGYLGDDRLLEDLRFIELLDIRLGDAFLLIVLVEDCRAVLVAVIRSLPVQLRGIVRDAEEDLEQRAVGDLRGIVGDFDRLGMVCL